MSKMLLSVLFLGLIVTSSFSKGNNDIYNKRDVYALVDTLPKNQKELVYARFMNVGGEGEKGFFVSDVPRVKEIVETLKKANAIEKELKEY